MIVVTLFHNVGYIMESKKKNKNGIFTWNFEYEKINNKIKIETVNLQQSELIVNGREQFNLT